MNFIRVILVYFGLTLLAVICAAIGFFVFSWGTTALVSLFTGDSSENASFYLLPLGPIWLATTAASAFLPFFLYFRRKKRRLAKARGANA